MVKRSPFEALCELAAREHWCWKIICTTCGHMCFRYGFRELSRGKHPSSPGWLVSRHDPDLYSGGEPRELGPLPLLGGWSIESQRALASVLVNACLSDIRSEARFPDWLGYLGLGLFYCKDSERYDRLLTKQWAPQLLEMLPRHARSRSNLREILNDPKRFLTWSYLGIIESDLVGP